MAVQRFKTPAGSSSIRYKTIPPKGGGGVCPPGTIDFTSTDTIDLSDALAGTLGPFNAPDTLDISDFFNAQDARVFDTVDASDQMGDISGLVTNDTVAFPDALAGTLGPFNAPDTFELGDSLVADNLRLKESAAISDTATAWALDANSQDSILLTDGVSDIIFFRDETLDMSDGFGASDITVDESIALADSFGAIDGFRVTDSLALADARTGGTITTEQADSLDFADILQSLALIPFESIATVDAVQAADLSAANVWAGTVVLATNWDNSALAVDLDEATGAQSLVQSSGIGGITNVNEAGDLTLSFPDITASMSAFTWSSVVLHYRWATLSTGTQVTVGTVSYTVRYSLNDGGAYTTIETITAPVSNPGAKTLDLTGIADTLAEIQQFRFRMDGTIGSGTGLNKTQFIQCFFARLVLVGTRTF